MTNKWNERRPVVSSEHLFTFAVIADSYVTEAEATAIGGYDIDTVKLLNKPYRREELLSKVRAMLHGGDD